MNNRTSFAFTPVPLIQTVDAYLKHVKVNQKLNTYRRYRSVLANFRDYFSAKKYLNEIGRGEILEYRDFRATRVDSPVTLNTEITMIRAFLYWCVEFKGLRENPAAKIKPRQVLQKPVSVYGDEEVALMLQSADAIEGAVLLRLRATQNTNSVKPPRPANRSFFVLILEHGNEGDFSDHAHVEPQ